jgi:hypothetical protein
MGRERVSDLEAHLSSALQSSYRIERELGVGGMDGSRWTGYDVAPDGKRI